MATRRSGVMSDMPKEGFFNKRTQVLISPTESETGSQISCADPQSVKEISKEVGRMMASLKSKARGQATPSRDGSTCSIDQQYRKSLRDMSAAELRHSVRRPSRELFGHHVPPLDVLPHYQSHHSKVLTDQEIDFVRKVTLQGGDKEGALQLHDAMQKCKDWLPCTVDVLRNTKVGMEEFAELLQISVGLQKATNAVLENAENHERVIDTLRNTLSMSLKPLEILHLFHKYDPNVLVEEDIDFVAELTLEEGDEIGTDELLDRLVRYSGWYPCLMQVLKDSSVGLAHLAAEVTEAFSEEFQEIKDLQQHAEDEFMARLAIIERKKDAKQKRKKKLKTPLMVTVLTAESSAHTDLGSMAPAHKLKKSKAWKKMLKSKHSCPRFTGIDWNRGLGDHLLDHLPTDVETAEQRAQMIENAKKDDVVQAPGQHERMLDPWSEAQKYAEKFALTELFTFLLTRLVLDTPNRPVDYLIDLTREINRLDMVRQQVDQLNEAKKKCEMEAAQRKSSVSVKDLDVLEKTTSDVLEKTTSESQNVPADEAEDENEKAKSTQSAKLSESTHLEYVDETKESDDLDVN